MTDIKDSKILIDTDIIIDYFRGIGNLGKIIDNSSNNKCYISVISIAEIYSNIFSQEYDMVERFLTLLEIVNVDKVISKLAGIYRMEFYKSHFLGIPDSLIAASVKVTDTFLITRNIKHFPMNDIQIIKPY
ncbi:Ribonuclease VapC10 [subsurface metagenome]|jgi:predicted nucleic acid-binding protein|nr:PIN domain-containing protein [Clostridia bacterium]